MARLFVDVFIAGFIYFSIFFPRWKKDGKNLLINTIFFGYICAVVFLTLLPLPRKWNPQEINGSLGNFIPFRDLIYGYNGALKDILLNTVMTIPFGILFPQIASVKSIQTVLIGFLISVCIESIQLTMTAFGSHAHFFDITDVITNTAGAFLGYLMFLQLKRICKGPES